MSSTEPKTGRASAPADARPAARDLLALAAALVLPAVVYHSIVQSYFHADDFHYLQEVVNVPLVRFLLTPSAGHLQIVRNLVFELSFRAFGTDPRGYLWSVLATHLLNVALLFVVIRRLTGRNGIASFGASLWGIAPAHEGTLDWYTTYGQVLAATCFLLVLCGVARRLADGTAPTVRDAARWALLLLVGAACFGVGVGVALAFPTVALLLFPRAPRAARRLLVVELPVLLLAIYWGTHKLVAMTYGYPADEALLALVYLLADLWQPLAMLANLLGVGVTTVIGNLAYPPTRYPDATGYALVVAFAAALAVDLATADRARRRLHLALLVSAAGAYAAIAAGRGVLYGALPDIPGHGAIEARYHYVAPIPLAIMLCLMLARAAGAVRVGPWVGRAVLAGWFAVAGTVWATSSWHIDHFDDDRMATYGVIVAIANAIAQAPPRGLITIRNQRFGPEEINLIFAGWASVYTIYFPAVDDRRVRFIEPDKQIRALALPGSRLARVLSPPWYHVPLPPPLAVAGRPAS